MIVNSNNHNFGNNLANNLYEKIDWLSSEILNRNLLDVCNALERKKILNIINEIKYDANRIKNSRHYG